MKYVLAPTNKDLQHYAKGATLKGHKYILRNFKNGKWHYVYKITDKDKELDKELERQDNSPKDVLGVNVRNNLYKSGGGSHSFGYSKPEKVGKDLYDSAAKKYKEHKEEKKRKKEEKKRKLRSTPPRTILGVNSKIYRSRGDSHAF